MFSSGISQERKQLQDLKGEVQKISGEHVKTEQQDFQLESRVHHCENEIGFR